MTWLVTGGAGYIGSHVVRAFAAEDIPAVVIDDLSSGHREFVDAGVPFYQGNVGDPDLLERHLRPSTRSPGWCIWRASSTPGFRSAGRCTPTPRTSPAWSPCSRPWPGTRSTASSSPPAPRCSAPRTPVWSPRPARPGPNRPYGESKLIGEWLLRDQARAHRAAPAHLAALLQRGRLGLSRSPRHQPAQPVPADLRAAGGRQDALHQRRRLPDPGRDLRPRLRPRLGSGGLPRRRGQGAD